MEYLGYFASILVGISLGLIGGGGSILTIPILVYLFKINPENATSYSLFIVGITALIGSYKHYLLGNLKLKTALYFTFPSVISLLFVREIVLPNIPNHLFFINNFEFTKNSLIMLVFAILMIFASVSMIKRSNADKKMQEISFIQLSLIGLIVGFVIGFLGAGGGFLIIPALIFFAGLEMKQAIGTSLFIIFINSIIGFGGDVINGIQLDYKLLFIISSIAIFGMFIGTHLSKKIDGSKLKPAFGWFVLIMGIYIISKEFFL
ncbi:hypothetical protein SAMN05660845_0859 [Flavobacterium swingsii]|jgi:uncharacterized membrane protein YfcA|uniref:Probable membrane transporter protein n=1 Tax=Flavobacterium swingsii TaxID=498292 RepID=A0A1I0WNZ1_9FLAO|nr:sulfite exporter TauE/SafE family protein [Flavobacterium swingsii]SFA89703.1 hypothetical protein SAMN05660845_0859 [Flavobacterium swingsii]